jgi:UV DNA damage repair endonuclease
VLDGHHHFIKTGEWIDPSDDRVKRVIDSWRGVRPVFHISQSREDGVLESDVQRQPQLSVLLEQGYKKSRLRAHSNYLYNNVVNDWVLGHAEWADLVVEAKCKNLAAKKLYEFWLNKQKLAA